MANERRIQRINKTLQKEIGEIIMRELKDPRLLSMVSVLDASLSGDMRSAKVTVSIFGTNELENMKTMEALNAASGFVSSIVSKSLRLKWSPQIKFERSHVIEDSVSMYYKIKEIADDGNKTEDKN